MKTEKDRKWIRTAFFKQKSEKQQDHRMEPGKKMETAGKARRGFDKSPKCLTAYTPAIMSQSTSSSYLKSAVFGTQEI